MENLNSILLVIQVLLSISLIALILLQHGKGADAGAAFGSGASATVFGAKGSGNFLSRMTTILAILFFIVCLALAYLASNREAPVDSVLSAPPAQTQSIDEGSQGLPPADIGGGDGVESDLPPAE
jgi:preprotein translocase subunit SecG